MQRPRLTADDGNPFSDVDVLAMDPTGGAAWLLLAALVLSFLVVFVVMLGLRDGDWNGGRLIGAAACLAGIVALWPLGALVDTTAPLAALALNLRPLALILGAGYPLYLVVRGR